MAGNPPAVTSVTYDKAFYLPGDTIIATVAYTGGQSEVSFTGTGTVTDTATGLSGQGAASFSVMESDATKAEGFTDTGGRAWAPVSDNGSVAVYTAVA